MKKTCISTLILLSLTAISIVALMPVSAITEDSWIGKTPLPTAREGFGVAVVNAKIYAIGGHVFSNLNEMYDSTSDVWTTLAPMPIGRLNFGIAVCQNKIYVIGGQNSSYAIPGPNFVNYEMAGVTGANEVYDPITNTWEVKAPMPTPRNYLQANVVDGKIYLIGGLSQQKLEYPLREHASNLTEVYDPETDTWSTMAPIPTKVWGYASAVINDKIYIISGWTGDSSSRWGQSASLSNQVQIFDPKTNSWTFGTPIIKPVTLPGAGATKGIMAPRRIYVIGGCPISNIQEQTGINSTQIYDPETNMWSTGAPMPSSRYGLAVGVVDDILYALGGTITANEQYTPIGYGTTTPRPSPSTSTTSLANGTSTSTKTNSPNPSASEFQQPPSQQLSPLVFGIAACAIIIIAVAIAATLISKRRNSTRKFS